MPDIAALIALITLCVILIIFMLGAFRLSGRADDTSDDQADRIAKGDERLGNVVERGGR